MKTLITLVLTLTFASGCYCSHRADRFTYEDGGVDAGDTDAGLRPDAGLDGGHSEDAGTDASAEIDGGLDSAISAQDSGLAHDAGLDGGPTCAADPNPEGDGSCTSTADCLTHCSSNWDVACFFGPFGRMASEGVCIYRDCRLSDIDIDFQPSVCPMFGNCPNRFCGRDRNVVTCCPPPGCNSFCSY